MQVNYDNTEHGKWYEQPAPGSRCPVKAQGKKHDQWQKMRVEVKEARGETFTIGKTQAIQPQVVHYLRRSVVRRQIENHVPEFG
jgi:hypothetical protein